MPTDRRVIFSSYVVPTQLDTMEEGAISQKSFLTSVGSALGGKGIASITATQWNDGWTSMNHPHNNKVNWEHLTDSDDVSGNLWEDEYTTWSGVYVAIAPEQLTPTMADTPLKFLYIRNVDDDNNALVKMMTGGESYDGEDEEWDDNDRSFNEDFKIKISPGASICLRGDGDFQCDELFVASDSGAGTAIEYIIAK